MHIDVRLHQHQTQALAINTQAIQSIQILQFGPQELQEFLVEQAEANPFLEVSPPRHVTLLRQQEFPHFGTARTREWPDNWDLQAKPITLREHLLQQVALSVTSQKDRRVAEEIVEALEPDGYFRRHPSAFAEFFGVTETDVLRVLSTIQTFEPTGVGARNLAECLALQLQERSQLTTTMQRLLDNLPLLANCKIDKLASCCGVSQAAVKVMAAQIRQLSPSPGYQFDSTETIPALPDVLVRYNEKDGALHVELNSELLPRIQVDRRYYAEIGKHARLKDDRRFLVDCYKSARWLTRALNQRSETLLKVATEIVTYQREFFERGTMYLKPLDLRTIAAAVGLHESTVCRAVANKYFLTERGLFEMGYFFSNGLRTSLQEKEVAPVMVQHRIKAIIDGEPEPLSDDLIVSILAGEGIEIARRTVAKYRVVMNIPSSSLRKRQRAMGL
jgi:RNA polymerase sigma-54 factor